MNYVKSAAKFVKEHAPQIIVGVGLSSVLGGTIALVPASFKACKKVMKREEEKGEKLTKLETVETVWSDYVIPTTAVAVGTGLVILGTVKEMKSISELTLALAAKESVGSEKTREKIKQKLGIKDKEEKTDENKIEKIEAEVIPTDVSTVVSTVSILPDERLLFWDELTNNVFYSTKNDVLKAINEFNAKLLEDREASVNEYCDSMGIRNISLGDELGWNIGDGLINVIFGADLVDDKPVVTISLMGETPHQGYNFYN